METESYSTFKYGNIVKELLEEKGITHYRVNGQGELTCTCPFHNDSRPSFSFSLTKGLYCCHACSAKGNIVTFVANIKELPIPSVIKELEKQGYEIENRHDEKKGYYTLEDYAEEKQLDIDFLTDKLFMHTDKEGKCVVIPYFNEQGFQVVVKYRHHPNSKSRFHWGTGSKNLYGLNLLDKFSSYVILVEGESDCHCAWSHDIYALGVPGAKHFKKEYAQYLDKFDKIYIHQEPDNGGLEFVKKICKCLPPEKLEKVYTISAFELDNTCKDLADLHKKGKLDKDTLLSKAQKVPKIYIKEISKIDEDEYHVTVASKVLEQLHIKFYNGNFYVYENGVYKENLTKIEKCIIDIDKNIKKSTRNEILDYLRIVQGVTMADIDINLINFKNGIYHIDTNTLEPHTPELFTLCQINADYLNDDELKALVESGANKAIDKFFEDICCGHTDRIDTLQEFIAYSFTYSVKIQKCLFLLGETADNGKSTFNELVVVLVGEDNCCSISISEFAQRFFGAELQGKLLNIVHEVENIQLRDLANFKTVISGNELSVEQKYKDRYKLKPFTHHIFAMNTLPELHNGGDEGYFRRIEIVPFEAKFTDDEKEQFSFDELVIQDSLNYLANISLRKYLTMINKNNRKFSNTKESDDIMQGYKVEDNSAMIFLNDVILYASAIDRKNNKAKVKELYDLYTTWCEDEHLIPMTKKVFKNMALGSSIFKKCSIQDGYDCIEYITNDKFTLPKVDSSSNKTTTKQRFPTRGFYNRFSDRHLDF